MASDAEFLDVRAVSVSFGTDAGAARVLDQVSLSMRQGEIMGPYHALGDSLRNLGLQEVQNG